MPGQMLLVPVGLTIPDGVTVMGNGQPITDPQGIERARADGLLLEQQPPEVQGAFSSPQEQADIGMQRAQAEGRTPLTDAGD